MTRPQTSKGEPLVMADRTTVLDLGDRRVEVEGDYSVIAYFLACEPRPRVIQVLPGGRRRLIYLQSASVRAVSGAEEAQEGDGDRFPRVVLRLFARCLRLLGVRGRRRSE